MQQPASKTVVAVLSDLLFTVKIQEAAKRAGLDVVFVKSREAALERARQHPAVMVFDLNDAAADPLQLIADLKAAEANAYPRLRPAGQRVAMRPAARLLLPRRRRARLQRTVAGLQLSSAPTSFSSAARYGSTSLRISRRPIPSLRLCAGRPTSLSRQSARFRTDRDYGML